MAGGQTSGYNKVKRIHATHSSSAERRKEIIQAALRCFSELGYSETNMSDICDRANASTGSVYHHFKSKEQLAAAVYLDGIGEYQAGLIKNLEKEREASRGIGSIIRYHITWVARNPEWSRFLFQKSHDSFLAGTDEQLNALNKNFAQKIMCWFSRYAEGGTVRRLPWDIVIVIVLGPCQEYARLYLSGKACSKTEQAIRDLSSAAWKALAPDSNRK
jgi:AcrR family transcriptional regulator